MLALLDAQYVYLAANQAYAEAFQRSQVDLVGHTVSEVFGDEFVDKTIRPNAEKCLAGEEVHYQAWFEFPAHGRRYMDISYFPYADEKGLVRGFTVHGRNITEQKKAQDERQRLTAILEATSDFVSTATPDGRITYINRSGRKMIGLADDQDQIEHRIADAHPDWASSIVENEGLPAAFERGIWKGETALLAPDGEEIPTSQVIMSHKTPEGQVEYLSTIIRDITERKNAEQALRQERDRAQKYLDVAGVMFVALNNKGEVILINRKGSEVLGYEQNKIIGKNWFDNFLPPSMNKDVKPVFDKLMAGEIEPVEYYENPILTKSGEQRIVAWHNTTLTDDHGNITGVLSSGEDITEQKKAKFALEAEKKFTENAINAQLDTFFVFNPETGKPVMWNKSFSKISEYSDEEIAAMKAPDAWYDPEDLKKAVATITQVGNKGASTVEIALRTKSGKKIPFEYRASHLNIEGEEPLVISIGRDITERKKAEQKLRSANQQLAASEQQLRASFLQLQTSENKYRSLIANIPGVVWTTDQNGNTSFISSNIENIYGYTPDEIYKHGESLWFGRIHPEDVEKIKKSYQDVFERQTPLDIEYRIKRKDGKWICLHDRSIGAYEIDGIKYADGVFFDITDRKKAEQELRIERDFIKRLQEASPAFFATIDMQGKTIQMNNSMLKALGYSRDEAQGTDYLTTFIPERDREHLSQIFRKHISLKETTLSENHVLAKDGRELLVEWCGCPILNPQGKVDFFFGVGIDITERKQAERELKRYQQQLKSLASELSVVQEKERRRIAAGLHDDVAQKLALAKLETQLLIPSIKNEKSLTAMQKQCHLIDSIIEDIRSLTFELGNPILYEVGLDAAVEAWLTERVQKKFGIKCKFTSDIQNAVIDQSTSVVLFQAVRELLANVIKHAKAKTIKVSIKTQNENLYITVEDNGIGFESPELAAKTQTMGGFGLFNIRERLEQLGGKFVINSKPAKGTQAAITVPLKNELIS
jgi:PAS domain S-box-containing protein